MSDSYRLRNFRDLAAGNTYPGRGIIIGQNPSGSSAMIAYFIMGRSENSRNRVFERFEAGMRTKAFDESKVRDPSLIIYNPYLTFNLGLYDIVTNGDQTNTIYDHLADGSNFEEALMTRDFEPDVPNYTPRISGLLEYSFMDRRFTYKMSIIKSAEGRPESTRRYFFNYIPENGIGHFIHTYKCDGNPIPSFYGEPEEIELPETCEELADLCWNSLNEDNKVSLFVREVPLDGSQPKEIIINKNN